MGRAVEKVARRKSNFLLICLSICTVAHAEPVFQEKIQENEKIGVEERGGFENEKYLEAKKLLKGKKWAEAAIILRKVVNDQPGFLPGVIDFSRALLYSDRREEAIGALKDALQNTRGQQKDILIRRIRVVSGIFIKSENFQVFQDGMHFLKTEQYSRAKDIFKKLSTKEPKNIVVSIRLGQSHLMDGNVKGAIDLFKEARGINPFEPEISLWLGRGLMESGYIDESLEELETAQKKLKNSERAVFWLAESLIRKGRIKQAGELLMEDIKKNPFHISIIVKSVELEMGEAMLTLRHLFVLRKRLQLALSRLNSFNTDSGRFIFESELGLRMFDKKNLNKSIDRLFKLVEQEIETQEKEKEIEKS